MKKLEEKGIGYKKNKRKYGKQTTMRTALRGKQADPNVRKDIMKAK
jgi:hypothetical protein